MKYIYTDGACNVNCLGRNNIGGYGYVILDNTESLLKEGKGKFYNTSNNRMEIMAVIKALEIYNNNYNDELIIYSDSTYVVNTLMKGWKKKKNKDLWHEMEKRFNPNIMKAEWCPGHAGVKWNEYCDKLSTCKHDNSDDIPFDNTEIISIENIF